MTVSIQLPDIPADTHSVVIDDALHWCEDNLGERFRHLQLEKCRWVYRGTGEFVFEREADAVLFALRWA